VESAAAANLAFRFLGQEVGGRIHPIADHERHHGRGEAEAASATRQPDPVAIVAEAIAQAGVF